MDNASVKFPAFSLNNRFFPASDLGKIMKSHYLKNIFSQVVVLLGAVLKPSLFTSEDKNMKRIRDPRQIKLGNTIEPYEGAKAEGQKALHTVNDGKFKDEIYLFHYPFFQINSSHHILASNLHFILLTGTYPNFKVEWVFFFFFFFFFFNFFFFFFFFFFVFFF